MTHLIYTRSINSISHKFTAIPVIPEFQQLLANFLTVEDFIFLNNIQDQEISDICRLLGGRSDGDFTGQEPANGIELVGEKDAAKEQQLEQKEEDKEPHEEKEWDVT